MAGPEGIPPTLPPLCATRLPSEPSVDTSVDAAAGGAPRAAAMGRRKAKKGVVSGWARTRMARGAAGRA